LFDSSRMREITPTTIAFKNPSFLQSHASRKIRILCELEETTAPLILHKLKATVLFFDSARARSSEDYAQELDGITECIQEEDGAENNKSLQKQLTTLRNTNGCAQNTTRWLIWHIVSRSGEAKAPSLMRTHRWWEKTENSRPQWMSSPMSRLDYGCLY
jgi:hypothetical protein